MVAGRYRIVALKICAPGTIGVMKSVAVIISLALWNLKIVAAQSAVLINRDAAKSVARAFAAANASAATIKSSRPKPGDATRFWN